MDGKEFAAWLGFGHPLSRSEWQQIAEAVQRYPYCAPLRFRLFQGARFFSNDVDALRKQREMTSLYLFDEKRIDLVPIVKLDNGAASEAGRGTQEVARKDEKVDIFKEINAYQEVSFKTAPKSVILSRFLDAEVNADGLEEDGEAVSVEDLGKRSVSKDEEICTPTLASILENQGKFSEAVAMYQKLMLKYPEKSATFASRIEALKKML